MGGLLREDVPTVVGNLLRTRRKVEITIRPEIVTGYYAVEWRFLDNGAGEGCGTRGGAVRE